MPSYGFRIRFLLPEDCGINHDAKILQIPLPTRDKEVLLKSVSEANIKDSNNLAIFASGFSSSHEADICGRRVKNSLLLCGLCFQMGFDVGKDEARGVITEYGKELLKKTRKMKEKTLLLNDIHGLCVYPEEKSVDVRFASTSIQFRIGKSPTRFVEEFKKAYELNPTDKQSLALELYNTSHFESSLRARFLTLVTAVECLCIQDEQPDPVVKYVETLIEQAKKSGIEAVQENSFLGRLGALKIESISKSCRRLVEKHLDVGAVDLFQECYDIRSDLSHDGKCQEGVDLGTYTPELDKLVSQLILADIGASANQ